MNATEEKVLAIVTERAPNLSLSNTDPLRFDFIKSGHVDSLGIIRFVCDLEAAFGVEIPMARVATCEFRTVKGVAAVIEELKS